MGFFKNLFRKFSQPEPEPMASNSLDISISSECYEVKPKQQTSEELVMADIGGYQSLSGGYVTYSTFKVSGISPKTNRKNTRQFKARDEDDAIKLAVEAGLREPFSVTPVPNREATENQLNYALSLGAQFPADVCFDDISCIIDRIVSEDELPPHPGLVSWALDSGIFFSRFANQEKLIGIMLRQLQGEDKWTFYSYLVYCEISGKEASDGRIETFYDSLQEYGKQVEGRPDLKKSFNENDRSNHYTKIYKTTKQWLVDHEII